jgi:2-dehydro-3-deoxygluconokinase
MAVVLPYDGLGRAARMGLNFTEVGAGLRASVTVYDRASSATAQMRPDDVDWFHLFHERGVRWFHTGGIFTSLSEDTQAVAAAAIEQAHEAGVFVSYDLNFRSKMWDSRTAIEVTRPLVRNIDCLIGNEEDFQKTLGYDVASVTPDLRDLPIDSYKAMVRSVVTDFPNLSLVGTTLREVTSASVNTWSAILYEPASDTFHHGPRFEGMTIIDRVGGGDGFASGLAWALLNGEEPAIAVEYGTVHGALVQSTRGDTSQVTLKELQHVRAGGNARIIR